MGLLYKGLSVWVQSRLDPCPNDTDIHTYSHIRMPTGFYLTPELLGFNPDSKNRDPDCKFPPKLQPGLFQQNTLVSDIAIFVLKRDVKLQLTN